MADPTSQAADWTQAQLTAPWDGYKMRTFIAWDSGNVQMAVAAADGAPAEIAKVHAAAGWRVVACVSRRTGQKATLPPREADTANQVFMGELFVLDTEDRTADGGEPVYTFAVVRRYALLVPVSADAGDNLNFGQPPYVTGSAGNNYLSRADLDASQVAGSPANVQSLAQGGNLNRVG